jgi:ATP-dependent Zn protease
MMDGAVAGRIAEEVVYGMENAGTGATSDFQSMMQCARSYVLRYGFSEKVLKFYLIY